MFLISPKMDGRLLEMDDIICPWCGEVVYKAGDLGGPDEYDGQDFVCRHCEREFMVNVDYIYTYSTVKIEPNATIQE